MTDDLFAGKAGTDRLHAELTKQLVRIYASNGGKAWRIYAPGQSYSMVDRKTRTGAVAYAKRTYPGCDIQVWEVNGTTVVE